MYRIFQPSFTTANSRRVPPEFEYIRLSYLRELLNYQDYYSNRVYAVKNQNFLVRLLTHVDTPLEYDTTRFIEATRTRSPYIAKAFRLTSEISYGDIHNGSFFGAGTDEIIVYEDTYFDPVYAEKNWKRIAAVNTLYHPRSDLAFMLPNGKASSTDTGIAFISINIPLLALQLRCFFRDQFIKRQTSEAGYLGLPHFVHMYVLPNMMYKHTDIVLMNRMMNMFYGKEMGTGLYKHAFPILNYANKLDSVLEKMLADYCDARMDYEHLLSVLPSVSSTNALEALMMPELAPTRQVWWALFFGRLKVMKFLIDVGGDNSISANRDHINRLKGAIRKLRNGGYEEILPYDRLKEMTDLMDELKNV